MNAVTFGMAVLLVCLVALLYCCYKTNKPLREKAREEAEAKAREEARREALIAESNRRACQREEVLEDLNMALSEPHRFLSGSVIGTLGRARWKYQTLADIAQALAHFKGHHDELMTRRETQRQQAKMLGEQAAQIKALQANIEDIKQALQMGQPVEF